MTLKELCARNVSAGLREVLNAANAAECDEQRAAGGAHDREIDDATVDLLATAAECLDRAAERLGRKAPKPAAPQPQAEPVGATSGSGPAGGAAKQPKKK